MIVQGTRHDNTAEYADGTARPTTHCGARADPRNTRRHSGAPVAPAEHPAPQRSTR